MLKYHSTYIGFREIPDEISLCINITNCPNNCEGCHSPWLRENIGTYLNPMTLDDLITSNKGISCVCFMGGDGFENSQKVNWLASIVTKKYNLKVGWYSGDTQLPKNIDLHNYDYIKLGPYIKEKGALDNTNTNQILYKVNKFKDNLKLENITYKFWNDNRN